MANTPKNVSRKAFNISLLLNAITIVGFLITIGTFIYTNGKKDERAAQQEVRITALEVKNTQINQQLILQNNETTKVNTKLGLLLDYFHIADAK
jgi:hypothetical protein